RRRTWWPPTSAAPRARRIPDAAGARRTGRGDPADHLVGGGRQQGRVVAQPGQLAGVLDERVQAAGDGGACGVVAGGRDDDVVRGGVEVRQVLAVDAGVGDRRGQIAGRFGPAGGREVLEVGEEVKQRRHLLLRRRAASAFLV